MRNVLAIALTLLASSTAWAGSTKVNAEDGTTLAAQHSGKGERGVLLVHNKGRSAADYEYLQGRLADEGFQVLSFDMRGHGETGGELTDEATLALPGDVCSASQLLMAKGATVVTVLGSGFGGAMAIHAAGTCETVHRLILLSPDLSKNGDTTIGASLEAMGGKPMLLVSNDEDPRQSRPAGFIEAKSKGRVDSQSAAGAGSGVKMLNREAGLEEVILSWLNESFELASGNLAETKTLETDEANEIETSGVEYGKNK